MTTSYQAAQEHLTGAGERFELVDTTVRGLPTRVFAHAPATIADIVASTATRGDEVFCVYEDERITFADWHDRVAAFAAGLVANHGVGKGDRVAIAMRNHPEWTIAWAAAVSVGAIAVSLNAWWTADELDFAIHDSTPRVVVADTERIERLGPTCVDRGITVIGVRIEGPVDGVADEAIVPFDTVGIAGAALPDVDIDPDDDATILYTSGTTGRPKGAVSTHRAIIHALWCFNLRAAVDRARTRSDDTADRPPRIRPVFILIVPLFHVTGCIPVMLSCIASGLKLVMLFKWNAERALELIEREKVTNFVGVPTQSADLVSSPRFAEFDTSSLRGVGGGGAPSPKRLVTEVDASFRHAKPTIAYGMTETNAYGPQNTGADYLEHPTSTGRTVVPVDIEARDDDGRTLPAGRTGQLWMRGPNLIRGYWNRPDATAETIVDGWLASGDIGRVDADGFVYVSDRVKDMVLRGGENIYCAEVEDVLYDHPGVHEVAVFGLPDDRLGETVAAAVHPAAGARVTAEELRAFAAERLAAFKVPETIDIRDEPLPRNASGKFLKRALRAGMEP